jgi:DNA polymerase III epsilon subunit-like protein
MFYVWLSRLAPVVALDLETTGIVRNRDRIIQYGVYGVGHGGRVVCRTAVVDSESPTGRDPFNLPGVTRSEVRAARPVHEHLDTLRNVLAGSVVVMHNQHHDWSIVCNEFKRCGQDPPVPRSTVCTLDLCKHRLPVAAPYRLGVLCDRFSIQLDVAHNALHDARATFELYMYLVNRYWETWFRQQPLCGLFDLRSPYWPPAPDFECLWASLLRARRAAQS